MVLPDLTSNPPASANSAEIRLCRAARSRSRRPPAPPTMTGTTGPPSGCSSRSSTDRVPAPLHWRAVDIRNGGCHRRSRLSKQLVCLHATPCLQLLLGPWQPHPTATLRSLEAVAPKRQHVCPRSHQRATSRPRPSAQHWPVLWPTPRRPLPGLSSPPCGIVPRPRLRDRFLHIAAPTSVSVRPLG